MAEEFWFIRDPLARLFLEKPHLLYLALISDRSAPNPVWDIIYSITKDYVTLTRDKTIIRTDDEVEETIHFIIVKLMQGLPIDIRPQTVMNYILRALKYNLLECYRILTRRRDLEQTLSGNETEVIDQDSAKDKRGTALQRQFAGAECDALAEQRQAFVAYLKAKPKCRDYLIVWLELGKIAGQTTRTIAQNLGIKENTLYSLFRRCLTDFISRFESPRDHGHKSAEEALYGQCIPAFDHMITAALDQAELDPETQRHVASCFTCTKRYQDLTRWRQAIADSALPSNSSEAEDVAQDLGGSSHQAGPRIDPAIKIYTSERVPEVLAKLDQDEQELLRTLRMLRKNTTEEAYLEMLKTMNKNPKTFEQQVVRLTKKIYSLLLESSSAAGTSPVKGGRS